ncbi:MAG TPA: thiamine phosphate synthase, partial [Pseudohongiella sp.]|nr:thiamine phosphate synthase [Pseudohongiella sp.]
MLRGVYAITDAKLLGEKRLLPAVEEALAGGVSLVQYRNKSADWSVRLGEATSLQALCSKF